MTSMSSNGARSIRNGGSNRSIINHNHNKHAVASEPAAVDIIRCTTSLRDPPNGLPSLTIGSVSSGVHRQQHQHQHQLQRLELEQREHATHGPPPAPAQRRSTNTSRLPAGESAMCCLETPGDSAMMPTSGTSARMMSNSVPLASGYSAHPAPPAPSADGPPSRTASAASTASSSASSSVGNRTGRDDAVDDNEDEDPYAELERILEKAQAEISEMFAQTVREEKMNCGSVSSSAGGTELPEGGSQLKRKSESKTAGVSSSSSRSNSSSDRLYQPQLHQQPNHRQQSSHHAKYATLAHPNVTQHHHGQTIGTATLGRNRQLQPADHEPKRTRNTFDPRYRSHDPLEVVSSTTGGGSGRSPQSIADVPSSSQSTIDAGSYAGRNATEHSDSLSDDMSLLDVGAVSAHEDSLEGAGDDTSDERETLVRRRYQRQSPRSSSSTAGARSAGDKSVAATGYYTSQNEPLADRSIKSSTNSLPSVAGHRNLALHLKFKSHQSAIDAKRKQFFLALDQEPFQPLNRSNIADLPSPSSTSLHSGHSHLIAEELGTKSSSAPVLLKDEENVLTVARANLRYSRSQSDRHLAEIEAIEACRWLRAAGFPQYAQMYEDHQFPIVVEDVAKDHPFLENDPLQSLFRRLHTLNRCANMHLDAHQHTPKPSQRDDSDDDSCALSEAWTFQHNSRRWSRVDDAIGLVSVINNKQQHRKDGHTKGTGHDPSVDACSGNPQHQQQHPQRKHNTLLRAEDHEKLWLESGGKITIGVPSDTDSQDDSLGGTVHLRRTGSERLKDGAKAILRRVESIKSRRRKKQNRDGLIILAPPSGGSHLSPHRMMDDGTPGGFDIMSYSNPTSPRPSAEMLHFDDAIDAAGNRKNLFASELTGRNLLSPNVNAWDAKRYGDRSSSPVTGTIGGGPLQFRQQVQLQHEARSGDDSSSICSEDSGGGGGGGGGGGDVSNTSKPASWKYPRAKKALRSKVVTSTVADDPSGGALSDSEYHASQRRSRIKVELASDLQGAGKDGVSTTTGNSNKQSGKASAASGNTLAAPDANSPSKLHRGGSLNLGKASKRYRDAFSNRSVRHSAKTGEDWEGRSTSKRSTVARWHSFQQPKVSPIGVQQQQQQQSDQVNVIVSNAGSKEDRKQQQQQQQQQRGGTTLVSSSNVSVKLHKPPAGAGLEGKPLQLLGEQARTMASPAGGISAGAAVGLRMSEMSCGQLQVVRKLGLANLTGYMERYCPTHRSGWNWELPKFIKRIKAPDYKDRKVFGMPLLLNLQKYGSTVPYTIRMAFAWLERKALDQVGLFRKPGVKSRIAKLKSIIEASNDVGCRSEMFDEYQAYDVADLLKQYFRELPDPLLTVKLSETFIAIFQYLPDEVRAEAVQSAILLLPDEHREVLHLLLTFLDQVVQNSSKNQMTANNLAVCFAPSLFYLLSGNRYTAASPRRKKTGAGSGTPDEKELSEAKASHECLAYMIERFQSLWTITNDQMRRCNFNYLDESKPVLLASLGAEMHVQNWRGYLSESINECLREGRERPRGWVSFSSSDPSVAVFYKKVGDGHPLRLWKCVTEVEAPPVEVMQHIVNERSLWDAYLLKWRTIEQLDQDTDVFQYACGQPITEYCVVRQWKNERGACVIVEVSISHESATSLLGGVNGVVLASRYLIEPCGSGKCKLMHLSRVDMKGRTPDWYNKNYGHICQQYLSRIKKFFEHYTEGPETKV